MEGYLFLLNYRKNNENIQSFRNLSNPKNRPYSLQFLSHFPSPSRRKVERYNSSVIGSAFAIKRICIWQLQPSPSLYTPFRSNCNAVSFVGYRCIYAPLCRLLFPSNPPPNAITTTIRVTRRATSSALLVTWIISCRWIPIPIVFSTSRVIVADFKAGSSSFPLSNLTGWQFVVTKKRGVVGWSR